MKKLLIVFCLVASAAITYAQAELKKPAVAASTDVAAMGKGIVDMLSSKLNLSALQIPKVTDAVSTFLTAKSGLSTLMKTNPADYKTKLASAQGDLTKGLKGTLNADQYTKFLSLKPTTADATNVLSQLF
jgi:parvulin-like peptidyl-prolyl isomerase